MTFKKKALYAFGILLVAPGLIGMMANPTPQTNTSNVKVAEAVAEQPEAPSCGDQHHISYMLVTETVKASLKAPASAQFSPLISGDTIYTVTENKPKENKCSSLISGWVDAQNSFGAVVRQQWMGHIQYDVVSDKLEVTKIMLK